MNHQKQHKNNFVMTHTVILNARNTVIKNTVGLTKNFFKAIHQS